MRINLEFNTADLIAVIVPLCLLGLAVKIIIGFFKEKKKCSSIFSSICSE